MNNYYVFILSYEENEIKPFEAHFTVNMDNQWQTYAFWQCHICDVVPVAKVNR